MGGLYDRVMGNLLLDYAINNKEVLEPYFKEKYGDEGFDLEREIGELRRSNGGRNVGSVATYDKFLKHILGFDLDEYCDKASSYHVIKDI